MLRHLHQLFQSGLKYLAVIFAHPFHRAALREVFYTAPIFVFSLGKNWRISGKIMFLLR